jgi:hypothetical protein
MERKMMIGIFEPKPARNFPPGQVRWIMRNDDLVKASVRTPEGVRIFPVWDAGDAWEPYLDCEIASKTRAVPLITDHRLPITATGVPRAAQEGKR